MNVLASASMCVRVRVSVYKTVMAHTGCLCVLSDTHAIYENIWLGHKLCEHKKSSIFVITWSFAQVSYSNWICRWDLTRMGQLRFELACLLKLKLCALLAKCTQKTHTHTHTQKLQQTCIHFAPKSRLGSTHRYTHTALEQEIAVCETASSCCNRCTRTSASLHTNSSSHTHTYTFKNT